MKRPKRGTIGFQHSAPKIIREAAYAVQILNSIRSRLNFAIKMWEHGLSSDATDDGLYLYSHDLVQIKRGLQDALAIVEHRLSQ